MFCTLVHADCKNAILRRIQENGKIYRGSLCFITVHVFPSFAFLLLVIGRICYPSDFLEKSLLLFLPVP